jgi:hypothetical protein
MMDQDNTGNNSLIKDFKTWVLSNTHKVEGMG